MNINISSFLLVLALSGCRATGLDNKQAQGHCNGVDKYYTPCVDNYKKSYKSCNDLTQRVKVGCHLGFKAYDTVCVDEWKQGDNFDSLRNVAENCLLMPTQDGSLEAYDTECVKIRGRAIC